MATNSLSLSRTFTGLIRRAGAQSQLAAASRVRGGAGLPVGTVPPPSAPLAEDEELLWDDGSPNPEPCLDEVAPMVGKYEALAMVSAGLGFFAFLGYLAKWNDKASRIPWTPREYPYDNLRVELGGEP
ncbi:hypothetical protein R1sor_002581 [Riccia sorocarpa]|uniref:NADH dehydrogenase [ubiquinone] 1 beta subcomplex subunit 8, mitochondrial n=1 Tax=Riccia sorocarpa TaxID=122646 RepID=A0ABD3H598_9MARC